MEKPDVSLEEQEAYQNFVMELAQNPKLELLDPQWICGQLGLAGIINQSEVERIRKGDGIHDRQYILYRQVLPNKDAKTAITGLYKISCDKQNPQPHLKEAIDKKWAGSKFCDQVEETCSSMISQLHAVKQLKDAYMGRCDVMKKQWRDFLDFPDEFEMHLLYTNLYLVNPNRLDDETPIEESNIFDGLGSRANVLIEGQGGTGKTTFVNKCTLDWATDNRGFLWPEKFNYVILVTLNEIGEIGEDFNLERLIQSSFDALNLTEAGSKILQIINMPEHQCKTLIILDGLDEIRSKRSVRQRNDFIKHVFKQRKLSAATVLATTRPEYFEKEKRRNATNFEEDRLIRMNGFTEEQRREYFRKWQVKKGGEKIKVPHPSLKKFLDIPLFSALYCTLNIQEEGVNLLQLVQRAVENMMERYKKKKNVRLTEANKKKLEKWLGQLAMQMLRPSFLNQETKAVYKNQKALLTLGQKIGILWPHGQKDRKEVSNADVAFPHRIFLEYFAASHFVSVGKTYKDAVELEFKETYFKYFLTGLDMQSAVEALQLGFKYDGGNCWMWFNINWVELPQKEPFILPKQPDECKRLEILNCCELDQRLCDSIWKPAVPKMKSEGWFGHISDLVLTRINSCDVLHSTDVFRRTSLSLLILKQCTIPKSDCKYLALYFKATRMLTTLTIDKCCFADEPTVLGAIPTIRNLHYLTYSGRIKELAHCFLQAESDILITELILFSLNGKEQTKELSVDVGKMLQKCHKLGISDVNLGDCPQTVEFWVAMEEAVRNLEELKQFTVYFPTGSKHFVPSTQVDRHIKRLDNLFDSPRICFHPHSYRWERSSHRP